MRPSKTALWITALIAIAASVSIGCTDVGDNSASSGGLDSGGAQDSTAGGDVENAADGEEASSVSVADASQGSDGGTPITAPPPEDEDAEVADSEAEDAGAQTGPQREAGVADEGAPDAESPDAGTSDSGSGAGSPDSEVSDAGTPDAGVIDAGAPDTGAPDAGALVDSGTPDSGTPADSAGGSPTACTSAPCAASGPNSVQCPNNAAGNGVCTPTEALLVARDIAQGNLTSAGQLKLASGSGASFVQGSCYSCLNFKDCLDGNGGDTGNECGDSPDLSTGAAGSGVGQCIATLTCILGTDCQGAGGIAGTSAVAAQESVGLCYCGGNNPGSTCLTAGTNTNGLCVTQEATGFGFAFSDNTDIVPNLTSQSFPSGEANAIFTCGSSNKCTICE
jgi:hypothetical protein